MCIHAQPDHNRKERLELKAELLAALQDLDARLAACREELTRQGPSVHFYAMARVFCVNAHGYSSAHGDGIGCVCGCAHFRAHTTAAETAAAQERKLETLNASLQSAVVGPS